MITKINEFYNSRLINEDLVFRGVGGDNVNSTYGGTDDGMGTFYTDSETMAMWFAGIIEYDVNTERYENTKDGNGKVLKANINLKNPYVIDESHAEYDIDDGYDSFQIYMNEIEAAGGVEPYKQNLISEGHDGIILKGNTTNYYEYGTYSIYIVF